MHWNFRTIRVRPLIYRPLNLVTRLDSHRRSQRFHQTPLIPRVPALDEPTRFHNWSSPYEPDMVA